MNDTDDISASLEAIDKAAQQDAEESFTSTLRENAVGMVAKAAPSIRWMFNLPRNVGVGTLDAVLETADFLDDASAGAAANVAEKEKNGPPSSAPPIKPPSTAPLIPQEWRDALTEFRGVLADDSSTGDVVTQKIAQFAVPFTGWSKMVGGLRGASTLSTVGKVVGAESATVASAFDPEEGRMADLIQQGRQLEGRLGDALRFAAPDGSATNAFIEYLASREGDTEAEGRFKNVVDNLGMTAAFAAVFKAGVTGLRAGRAVMDDPNRLVSSHWAGKFGRNEEGKIAFHGSQADFDEFDLAYVGTGEGHQAFGHGLYLAESKGTGKTYTKAGGPRYEVDGTVHSAKDLSRDPVQAYVLALYDNHRTRLAGNETAARRYTEAGIKSASASELSREEQYKALAFLRSIRPVKGKVYHVDIPDTKVTQMLDWDAPLSQQPEVLEKLTRAGYGTVRTLAGQEIDVSTMTGGELVARYQKEGFGPVFSEDLSKAGIPGIRYLDKQSRGAGEGTRNYVVFDPADLKIVKKE